MTMEHQARGGRKAAGLALCLGLVSAMGGCAAKPGPSAVSPIPPAPPSTAGAPAPAAAVAPAVRSSRPPGPPPLVGSLTRADVEGYEPWRALRAADYTPDAQAVRTIAEHARDVETLVILGTWCGDSKRDVPRYFKILDQAGLRLDRVTLVGVDRTKIDAGGLTAKHGVTRVPTFVFLRGGIEIGRVVERPATTLEQEIAAIVARR